MLCWAVRNLLKQCDSGFGEAIQKPAKWSRVSSVARPRRNVAPRKLASFSPLDMSSAPRKSQPSEQKINQQCSSRLFKTQKYFLPVDDNQVSTVFCVIGLQSRAFAAASDTKNRDFLLS